MTIVGQHKRYAMGEAIPQKSGRVSPMKKGGKTWEGSAN